MYGHISWVFGQYGVCAIYGAIAAYTTYRDTVSSVGITRGPTLPETTTGMRHVCVFRHALALDERRVKFLPEYANGGAGPITEENDRASVQEHQVSICERRWKIPTFTSELNVILGGTQDQAR